MSTPAQTVNLGTVLVVGGCGFLGHHLVRDLLADPACTSVAVMSRGPFENMFDNVTYITGDITSPTDCQRVVNQVKPQVIFNTASPLAYIDHEHAYTYFTVNIDGNSNLLKAAAAAGTVKAFVYTSSAPIIAGAGGEYDRADETALTLAQSQGQKKGDPYHVAKALGDQFVLAANGNHGIRTATIRPTAMYGEGDRQMIPHTMDVLKKGQTNFWMGYNNVEMDVVYVGHVARAEVLCAKGLLAGIDDPTAPKVDGQAFNITDDKPSPPWSFFRQIWIAAGDKTPMSSVWMLSPWLSLLIVAIAEWFFYIISFGKRRPRLLVKERIEFVLYTRTYSIQKARKLLGYEPFVEQSEAVKKSVDWYLKKQSWNPVVVKKVN